MMLRAQQRALAGARRCVHMAAPACKSAAGAARTEGAGSTAPMAIGPVRAYYNEQVRKDYLRENASQVVLCDALDSLLAHVNATITDANAGTGNET